MKSTKQIVDWAKEQAGDCDCAGGCWCHAKRMRAIEHYRTGLRDALRAAGEAPANGGFRAIDSAIRDLIVNASMAMRRERAKQAKVINARV